MQNSNEEDFKKKYLKYKAKYLELKELLEGAGPGPRPRPGPYNCGPKNQTDCIYPCVWTGKRCKL